LTDEEFSSEFLMETTDDSDKFECPKDYKFQNIQGLPDNVDYRTTSNHFNRVLVTEVKDQGQCASEYAFSAMAALEGSWCKSGWNGDKDDPTPWEFEDCSTWPGFSVQMALDCGTYYLNREDDYEPAVGEYHRYYPFHGCFGGWPGNVWQWAYLNYGVSDETDYPYASGSTGSIGQCLFDPRRPNGDPEKIVYPNLEICGTLCRDNSVANFETVREALYTIGPMSAAMFVNGTFRYYESGIYIPPKGECGPYEANHAMPIVGYGEQNGIDYWIVKNSWSKGWGDQGYIKVAAGRNYCGVEQNIDFVHAHRKGD